MPESAPNGGCFFCRKPFTEEDPPERVGQLIVHKGCAPTVRQARKNFQERFKKEDEEIKSGNWAIVLQGRRK